MAVRHVSITIYPGPWPGVFFALRAKLNKWADKNHDHFNDSFISLRREIFPHHMHFFGPLAAEFQQKPDRVAVQGATVLYCTGALRKPQ